jgi:hypothetical protein
MLFKNNFPKFRVKLNINFGSVNLHRYFICVSIEIRLFKYGLMFVKDFYFDFPDNGVLDDSLYNRMV